MAYRASLTFQFPKGYLETTDFGQIQRTISQVLAFAGSETTNTQPAANPAKPQTEPARIALGQTTDQVTASLGQPDKVVDLGSKKIYFYRDLKITFLDGKVSDVQ